MFINTVNKLTNLLCTLIIGFRLLQGQDSGYEAVSPPDNDLVS